MSTPNYSATLQIPLRCDDQFTVKLQELRIEIDIEALAKLLGPRAVRAKRKRAVTAHGAVTVRAL